MRSSCSFVLHPLVVVPAAVMLATLVSGCSRSDSDATTATSPVTDALVARGAYVAKLADCSACHTVPHTPDFSGGLPLRSPLGVIYSTNITPDRDTGIGAYSLEDFTHALRDGDAPRHRLYPAMPYPSYARVSDADIAALYAYFMHGVAPVRQTPPKTNLPFPFDQRWGMALWNVAFLERGVYEPDARHDAAWNRGAYLVQGLGHCGSCHTPRGPAYEERGYAEGARHFLTGGTNDHWFAPNLTGEAASGLGRWSGADIVQFLKTGHGAQSMVFGPMKQVVDESTQHVDERDLESIAAYLKSLPARAPDGIARPVPTSARQTIAWVESGDVHVPGDGLFMNFCAGCHGRDGSGDPAKAPALARSAVVRSVDPASIVNVILAGGKPHRTADQPDIDAMPSFAGQFDDREVAEVASFVRRSWGNDARPVAPLTVERQRKALVEAKEQSPTP